MKAKLNQHNESGSINELNDYAELEALLYQELEVWSKRIRQGVSNRENICLRGASRASSFAHRCNLYYLRPGFMPTLYNAGWRSTYTEQRRELSALELIEEIRRGQDGQNNLETPAWLLKLHDLLSSSRRTWVYLDLFMARDKKAILSIDRNERTFPLKYTKGEFAESLFGIAEQQNNLTRVKLFDFEMMIEELKKAWKEYGFYAKYDDPLYLLFKKFESLNLELDKAASGYSKENLLKLLNDLFGDSELLSRIGESKQYPELAKASTRLKVSYKNLGKRIDVLVDALHEIVEWTKLNCDLDQSKSASLQWLEALPKDFPIIEQDPDNTLKGSDLSKKYPDDDPTTELFNLGFMIEELKKAWKEYGFYAKYDDPFYLLFEKLDSLNLEQEDASSECSKENQLKLINTLFGDSELLTRIRESKQYPELAKALTRLEDAYEKLDRRTEVLVDALHEIVEWTKSNCDLDPLNSASLQWLEALSKDFPNIEHDPVVTLESILGKEVIPRNNTFPEPATSGENQVIDRDELRKAMFAATGEDSAAGQVLLALILGIPLYTLQNAPRLWMKSEHRISKETWDRVINRLQQWEAWLSNDPDLREDNEYLDQSIELEFPERLKESCKLVRSSSVFSDMKFPPLFRVPCIEDLKKSIPNCLSKGNDPRQQKFPFDLHRRTLHAALLSVLLEDLVQEMINFYTN
ncbi:hypothetical protein [Gimesia maris]|uniref:hypothetical protein n=1 Tax=Gimesia maris TaxID=122 RepID=UPI0032EDEB71